MTDEQVNLTDDELAAAWQAGWLDDQATLNKLDSDTRRRFTRIPRMRPTGSDRNRVDTNMVGVDHDRLYQGIANWASTLPSALQEPAARTATYYADVLASLLELVSAPESVVTMGAQPALGAMDATGDAARRLASVPSRLRVDPKAAVDNFSLNQPQRVLKGVSLAEEPVSARVPGFDRYSPNRSGYTANTAQEMRAVAETAPAIQDAAPIAPETPAPTGNGRTGQTINDAMQEAMRKAQAEKAAATSRAGSAPAAPRSRPTGPISQRPASPTPEGSAPSPSMRPRLSAKETQLFLALRNQGKSVDEAYAVVERLKRLAGGLPDDAAVRGAVAGRNATGRWREE